MISNKIISIEKLLKLLKILRSEGKKIVTYNGSFDIVHAGHVYAINEAKNQGDILIVLINSDKSVSTYKSNKRPIIHQKYRAELIAAFSSVDYVVLFDDLIPNPLLEKIKPDIHCNGSDWGENCIEKEALLKYGGKLHIIKIKAPISTTDIIKKIISEYSTPLQKAVFIDRDGTLNDNKSGYIYKIEDFKFLPGVIESLKKLSSTDFKIIIVTNQSGIGRGYYSLNDFNKLNNYMIKKLKTSGIRIDKVYFCPHNPNDNCICRKPRPGLLIKAVEEFKVSLNDSWIIGNDEKDVLLGRYTNTKTIKIGLKINGYIQPNYYVKDFNEAVNKIII